jgi:RNA polymerase sigma-70 factor, ECF subfamily
VNNRPTQASVSSQDDRSAKAQLADSQLVLEAKGRDHAAFRTLFERYHRRLLATALGVLRNKDDALDVVQDAFIKAYNNLDGFSGNSSFYTWIYRITMNLAIDKIRKLKRRKPVEITDHEVGDGSDASLAGAELLPRILAGNPGRALLDKQIRVRIDEALAELSENHRAVLVMRELDGLSYEEMAETMGCSKGTIMSRLFHARRNMQRRLIDLVDRPSSEVLAQLGGEDGAVGDGAEERKSRV